jgi:hypothetical protein
MTEQTFPSGGTAVAEPPLPALPMDGGDSADDGSRRKLLLVGAALGVLVLAIAAFFLLKGGGSSTPAASGSPTTTTPVSTPKVTHHKAAAKKPLTLPKHYNGHVGRDPFKPLYVEPAAAPAAPTTATNGSTSTTTDGSTSTTDGSTTTSGSNTGTTTHKPVYRPIWIQLHRLSGNKVIFDIGYSNAHNLRVLRFTVTAPTGHARTVFAQSFSLLRVSGSQVTVQYGDGTPFVMTPAANTMIVN